MSPIRRRLAPVLLCIGLAIVPFTIGRQMFPHEQNVVFELHARPEAIETGYIGYNRPEFHVRYLHPKTREELRDVIFALSVGDRQRVEHHPILADGPYIIVAEISGPGTIRPRFFEQLAFLQGDATTRIEIR